jgi:hypothetical protein
VPSENFSNINHPLAPVDLSSIIKGLNLGFKSYNLNLLY